MNKILLFTVLFCAFHAKAEWVDLYDFPYFNTPLQIMMGISCAGENTCWITGGNTNTAFGIYRNADDTFNTMIKSDISSTIPPIMLLSIAMQDDQQGVAGGVGLLAGGTYWTANGADFTGTIGQIGVLTTQAMYSLGLRKYAYIGQYNSNQGVAFSNNGGNTFAGRWFEDGFCDDAPARYGAFPSDDVWYVTGGRWPSDPETYNNDQYPISERIIFNQATEMYEFLEVSDDFQVSDDNGYTAMIAKTTNGGQTWEKVFEENNSFYFNAIDCASVDVCMAVAEGTAGKGGKGGARVLKTSNGGSSWEEVLVFGEFSGGSALDIKMLSETEAWAGTSDGTSMLNAGVSYSHTTDGGATWTTSPKLANIGAVTAMSFLDNGNAYACGITVTQMSTLMKFEADQEQLFMN